MLPLPMRQALNLQGGLGMTIEQRLDGTDRSLQPRKEPSELPSEPCARERDQRKGQP